MSTQTKIQMNTTTSSSSSRSRENFDYITTVSSTSSEDSTIKSFRNEIYTCPELSIIGKELVSRNIIFQRLAKKGKSFDSGWTSYYVGIYNHTLYYYEALENLPIGIIPLMDAIVRPVNKIFRSGDMISMNCGPCWQLTSRANRVFLFRSPSEDSRIWWMERITQARSLKSSFASHVYTSEVTRSQRSNTFKAEEMENADDNADISYSSSNSSRQTQVSVDSDVTEMLQDAMLLVKKQQREITELKREISKYQKRANGNQLPKTASEKAAARRKVRAFVDGSFRTMQTESSDEMSTYSLDEKESNGSLYDSNNSAAALAEAEADGFLQSMHYITSNKVDHQALSRESLTSENNDHTPKQPAREKMMIIDDQVIAEITRSRHQYSHSSEKSNSTDQSTITLEELLTSETQAPMVICGAVFQSADRDEKMQLLLPILRLFTSQSKLHQLLTWAISVEVQSIQSVANLFRSDDYTSRLVSHYTKSVGTEFLENVLSDPVRFLFSLDVNEIEISRDRDHTLELDEDRVRSNAANLMQACQLILDAVLDHAHNIPRSFFHLCYQLNSLMQEKFNGSNSALPAEDKLAITRSVVGGFFFLRYICPAITTPHLYNLTDQEPRGNIRRILVLITKLLFKTATSTPFDPNREPESAILNDFIYENESAMGKLFETLTASPTENIEVSFAKDAAGIYDELVAPSDENEVKLLLKIIAKHKSKIETTILEKAQMENRGDDYSVRLVKEFRLAFETTGLLLEEAAREKLRKEQFLAMSSMKQEKSKRRGFFSKIVG